MANVLIDENTMSDIADAIRAKLNAEDTYLPSEMADAIGDISGGGITPTGTKEITSNGTSIDVTQYAYADVAVPNTYSAGDEGKVVSNGALVAQTSDTVTTNDTYDTTLINSLTVNVSGGGGSSMASGSFTQSGNSLSKTIDIGDSTPTKFLIYATTSPYGNGVRCGAIGFIDFTANMALVISAGATGSNAACGYNYGGTNGFTKSGSTISISSGGSNAGQFNYFVDGITYQWYAW